MIRFHTFGRLELRGSDGRTLGSILAQPKRTALLAYLALGSSRGYHRRDTLLGLFWPDADIDRARHSLNQAVYALRSTLGMGVLVSRGSEEIGLAPGMLWCDAAAFEEMLKTGDLESALELHQGDLLSGFFLAEAAEFEKWLESERLRLRGRAVEAAWQLADREVETENMVGAARWARRAVGLAPDDELSLRRLVALLDRAGDRSGALAAYEAFARRMAAEYGADPSPETRELAERMFTAAPKESPAPSPAGSPQPTEANPPLRSAAPAETHRLPVPSAPLVGREAELVAVRRLLEDRDCRLLTIVGPGGSGKTRLALEVGSDLGDTFADGARFVSLASVDSVEIIPSTLARALDLSLAGEHDPEEQILHSMVDREILLILDNFDHLLGAAGFVAELLQRAPRSKLLVTSREALNVRGESLYSLEGLQVPRDVQCDDAESYGAVELFVQTARRVQAGYTVGSDERTWIVRICQLVDGLPLAVELAAAWVRVLSTEELCREIERSLAFVAAPLRGLPERHRSLQATFEYSCRHLTSDERAALRGLAVFRGGFRREAAATVADATDPLLLALVNKSLLRRHPSGRFEMLEVLRQFAEEQLEPLIEAVHDRHCEYYARWLGEREAALAGRRQHEVLGEIGVEIANLRTAWEWAVARGKTEELARALQSLFVFYDVRGWHQEGEVAFARAAGVLEERIGPGDGATGRTLARLLGRQAVFCLRLGRHEKGRGLLERSLALSRSLNDSVETALSLDRLGVVFYNLGRYEEARRCQEEALAIRRGLGHAAEVAVSLNNLGSLAYALGDHHEARRLCAESLAMQRQLGDEGGVVVSLHNLSYIALLLGEEREARRLLDEALSVARESGSRLLLSRAFYNVGNMANAVGDSAAAKAYLEQAFAAALESGATAVALDALVALSATLARCGDKESALELLACALRHPAAERRSRDAAEQLLGDLRSDLPPAAVEAAVQRARTLPLDAMLDNVKAINRPSNG